MTIKWIGASDSNYSDGRQGNSIDAIVVHWIVGTLESADATFQDGRRNASAHYGVGGEEIHQYVKDEDTAWHCGDWLWNLKTIGIEHEGGPDLPISDATYETSAKLIKELCTKYNIPLDKDHILPHNHFVPTQCPGDLDIDRLISLAVGDIDCQDKIDELEEELDRCWMERDRKDRKLEICRDERAELELRNKQLIENYDKQIKGLQNDLAGVRLENKEKKEYIEILQEDKKVLEGNLGALGGTLEKERENYAKLEEKHKKCMERLDNFVENTPIVTFIWRKIWGVK